MDILEELRDLDKVFYEYEADNGALLDRAANEIEELRKQRNELREALKTFANNVKETNEGIDENWAKTVYPLKAENQQLREALKQIADAKISGVIGDGYNVRDWLIKHHVMLVNKARAALKEGE